MASPTAVTLRRSPWARLFGGYWFQTFLTTAIVVQLLLVGVLVVFGVSLEIGGLLPTLPAAIVLWVLWLFGVFARAHADRAGVHVRYFTPRHYSWSDVERVTFTNRIVLGRSGEPTILLTVGGADHLIRPACQCSRAARLEFGDFLTARAREHGIEVAVKARERRWDGLTAYPAN